MNTDDQNREDNRTQKKQIRYADAAHDDAKEQADYLKKKKTKEELQDEDHRMDLRTHGQIIDDEEGLTPEKLDLEIRWKRIKNDYLKAHPSLTEEDVAFKAGDFGKMTERIAKKTNRKPDDVQDEIRKWNLDDKTHQ